jgi:hypothetical protein
MKHQYISQMTDPMRLPMRLLQGAVALSVQLLDYRLLFIGSHFAAHDNKVERRNADFTRIKTGLFNSSSSSSLAELGASGGSFSSASGARTPGLAGTLPQADAEAMRRGSRSQQGGRAELLGGEACPGSSSMRQPGSGRAAGSPLTGWLSGVWDAAGTQQRGSCQGSSCASVSPSGGSECAGLGQQVSGCNCSEVCNLRAASCPPCQTCREQQHIGQQHHQPCVQPQLATLPALRTGAASLKGRVSFTPTCSTPRATLSPRTPASAAADCGLVASQYSAGAGDSSIGRSGQREVSFAEELHQQLSTFKSFILRRTSVNLLGSRSATAVMGSPG